MAKLMHLSPEENSTHEVLSLQIVTKYADGSIGVEVPFGEQGQSVKLILDKYEALRLAGKIANTCADGL